MPRRPKRIPKYRLHKPTGLAVVRLSGRDIYLGKHGSPSSHRRYEQAVSEWLANNRQAAGPAGPPEVPKDVCVNELILAYLEHAEPYYRKKGMPTGECDNIKDALRQMSRLYGKTPAAAFGPGQLKTIRRVMIEDDLCRNVINARIGRIRRMFKWGVENDMIDVSALQSLQSVAPLKQGRSGARETEHVSPVPQERVEAVLRVCPHAPGFLPSGKHRSGYPTIDRRHGTFDTHNVFPLRLSSRGRQGLFSPSGHPHRTTS